MDKIKDDESQRFRPYKVMRAHQLPLSPGLLLAINGHVFCVLVLFGAGTCCMSFCVKYVHMKQKNSSFVFLLLVVVFIVFEMDLLHCWLFGVGCSFDLSQKTLTCRYFASGC